MTTPQYTEESMKRTEPQAEYSQTGQDMTQQGQPVQQFEDTLTRDMRVALHDFVEVTTVCNWCADQCLGTPEMEECARLCRDVADLAALNVEFMARDSTFGVDVAETFAHAADECEQVCAQHPDSHCQECASVLRRAIDSTWAMLDSFEHSTTQEQQIPAGGY